ncbi:DUF4382 domain-containing protein [bacterium]|nr:DUF4382 domain-containing protein [bacterium]
MKKIWLPALALIALGTACSEDEKSDPVTGYSLSLKSGPALGKNQGKTQGTVVLNSAYAVLTEVELEDEDSNGDDVEIDIEGEFTFDLLTGTSLPALPTASIPAGTYDELDIELGDDDNGNAVSLYADGTRDGVSFEIEVRGEVEFSMEDDVNGIVINANQTTPLTANMAIATVVDQLDWTGAVADGDGVVRINATSNTSMYSDFLSKLQAEVEIEDED